MPQPRTPARTRLALAAVAFSLVGGLAACSSDGSDGRAKGSTTTTAADGSTTTSGGSGETLAERLEAVAPATKVEGPITGGTYDVPYLAMPEGWEEDFGYTEEEFFLSGEAASYAAEGELAVDGEWDVTRTEQTAPYTTRVVVRRPADPEDFNGTLVVEWLNVSAGRDSDPDFGFLADELLANGYAYAAVSAQKMGVEPGGLGIEIPNVPAEALAPLKTWDPERYGDLSHPGDEYSYDIFSQAARTLIEPGDDGPLGGLDVQRVIAVGESQSAFRLTTYVNGIQPLTGLFDGFLIHSRGSASADLNAEEGSTPPDGLQIRADGEVPVFQFATETDLDFLGFVAARQDDHETLVTWEAAGTAHADRSTLDYAVEAGRRWTDANVDLSTTCGEVNDGPQEAIVQQGFASLQTWIADGTPPPASPRIETDDAGEIVRADDGIALGGIRTPAVDAPTSVLTGDNPTDSVICSLFGSTTPLTSAQLSARYADHDAYVAAVTSSADAAVEDGFLSPAAAEDLIEAADSADVP